MRLPLSQEQVDGIWITLTLEQQTWINEYTKQKKRDKWFEALAARKGIVIDDQMSEEEKRDIVDDWELVEILDGGEGNRPYKCECGKRLRYQYTVYHPSENKYYYLGSTCIEHYTSLTADVVRDIMNGIFQINTKRDELLLKIQNHDFINLESFIEKGVLVPESIQKQVNMGLPLLDEQLHYLSTSLEEIEWQKVRDERKKQREDFRRSLDIPSHEIKSKEETRWISQNAVELPYEKKHTYTYESFMNENLNILKRIREKEESLSPKLYEEWMWMQEEVRHLKKEGTMDFDKFIVRMNNMMIPLRIIR